MNYCNCNPPSDNFDINDRCCQCAKMMAPSPAQKEEGLIGIGNQEHRGNTVDYVYDKCRVYGDQISWQANKIAKAKAILDEDWQGSVNQELCSRRNEEYTSVRAQLTTLTSQVEKLKEALIDAKHSLKHLDEPAWALDSIHLIDEALAAVEKDEK